MMGRFVLLKKQDLEELDTPTTTWVIPDLLAPDVPTVFVGPPGAGKSTLVLDLMMALQNGVAFPLPEDDTQPSIREPIGTAWLTFESGGATEFKSRLALRPREYESPSVVHLKDESPFGQAHPLKLSEGPQSQASFLSVQQTQAWQDLGYELQQNSVKFLVIDSIGDLTPVESRDGHVRACFDLLNNFNQKFGVTPCLIAHSSAHANLYGQGKREILGATAWEARSRHVVFVSGNSRESYARVQKSNIGETGVNFSFHLIDGGPVRLKEITRRGEQAKSKERRDWETLRDRARQVRDAGQEAWTSQKAIGASVGKSRRVAQSLIKGNFFVSAESGGFQPNHALIDGDWEAVMAQKQDG